MVRTLRAEELARDVEILAADDHNLLAAEQLLGDNAGQTAKQVALAIDDDLMRMYVSLQVACIWDGPTPPMVDGPARL